MAKRFTDTDKWKKPFIKQLPAPYKLLWLYILDDCDHAGIWQVDIDVANLRLGGSIKQDKAIQLFGSNIEILADGEKWFVRDFVDFQYGTLNIENRAHKSVLDLLNKANVNLTNKPLISPLEGRKDKDKDMDKDKDKVITEELPKTRSLTEIMASLRKEYSDLQVKDMNSISEFIEKNKPSFSAPYVDLWNLFAEKYNKPACMGLRGTRRGKLDTRLQEKDFDFVKILKRVRNQAIAMEQNWFNLTWILENDNNYVKVLEGNFYRNEVEKNQYFIKKEEKFEAPTNAVD